MRKTILLCLTVLLPASCAAGSSPADYTVQAPVIEQTSPTFVQASGGVVVTQGDTTLQAQQVSGDLQTYEWLASGDVRLRQGENVLQGDSLVYNYDTRAGKLTSAHGRYGVYFVRGNTITLEPGRAVLVEGASLTTCDLDDPHWLIGARSIRIIPGQYGIARRLTFAVGNRRILAFPRYRFGLTQQEVNLPTPGFDRRDGAYLRFNYPLSVPWASAAGIYGRLAQRNGALTTVEFQRELQTPANPEPLMALEEEVVQDFSNVPLLTARTRALKLKLPTAKAPAQQGEDAGVELPSSHVYIRFANKERVTDPDSRFIYMDRLPEAGIRFLREPLAHISAVGSPLYFDVQLGYGRFRERQARDWIGRLDARAVVRLKSEIGRVWKLEPAAFARTSRYSDDRTQDILGVSLAVGRQITPDYFLALTYITHWQDGGSPLEFDDVDVPERLATRLEAGWGKTRGTLTLDFDLQRGGLYDWGVDLARKNHCYEPRLSYRNRYSDFTFGFAFAVP